LGENASTYSVGRASSRSTKRIKVEKCRLAIMPTAPQTHFFYFIFLLLFILFCYTQKTKNIKSKIICSKHKIIDETFKDITKFKDNINGEIKQKRQNRIKMAQFELF
jgi:hypothetical protein